MTDTAHAETFDRLREVRKEALAHSLRARELAGTRRDIMLELLAAGVSQAEIARELGVSRQAVQKMLSM